MSAVCPCGAANAYIGGNKHDLSGNSGLSDEERGDGRMSNGNTRKGEDVIVTIPAPIKGEDGKGISSIIGIEEDGLYKIPIYS